ncbi:MAG: hypothetical protein QM493_06300 [Sulfurovum sp.]
MLEIVPIWFIRYKFFNSLFLGISVGAIFTLYTPLNPSIYSIGGVVLAFGMLGVAKLYHKILNAYWFFRISLIVEVVLLLAILYFLVYDYGYSSAFMMYVGYQITFVFGSYLIRAETLLLASDTLLSRLDSAKQFGYLLGMSLAYGIYQIFDYLIISPHQQVYYLHFLLLSIEIGVIWLIFRSFKKSN